MPGSKFTSVAAILVSALALAGCGNKTPKLNIPDNPPPGALQPELTAENLLRMGQRVEAGGDYNSAGNFYADALERDENLVEAHLGLGRVLTRMGQERAGALAFGRAWELRPDNMEYLRTYLQRLLPIGGEQLALEAIGRHLKSHPPTPEVLNFKGIALDLMGQYDEAEAAFREGLALTSTGDTWNGRLLGNLALSLGLSGETTEAVLLLNPFIGDMTRGHQGLSPYQSELRQNLALVYALAGNPDSAVEVAKSALSADDAEYNRGFYEAIAGLSGADRVRAVFLGELPEASGP